MEEPVPDTPQYSPHPRGVSLNQNQPLTKASRMWSVAEDEALIGLYLQFSEDAIVGTNQKAATLWQKIYAAYDQAHYEKPHILPPRPLRSLESRWRRMATDLIQWSSCYDEAGRANGSGYNEADRIHNANDSSGSEKRCRTEDEDDVPNTGFISGGLPRPDGVKKAKSRRNKGKGVAFEVSNINEQMQQNNASREIEAQMRLKKLDFDMERERRKQKQVELHQKQVEIQERRLNYEMLQDLMAKGPDLTLDEEAYKEELRALLYCRRSM
ncbi:uncharacterized protein LOC110735970 [Chenopodium quinoa]|uniref:uncharacterized protein LOC110735970 n=1 Tax=Chenopodium quinoa TaxID=63459 RepID=UPI000B78279D|nr:uncharacterized protein LOC110735970 [Chenopodium quinoa]